MTDEPFPKQDRYDLWLSRLSRTGAAILGLTLIAYEGLKGKSVEFALVGMGMVGLPFGRAVERFLEWITTMRSPQDK